ncbi:MAG: hypothetical protein H6942_07485, partial [Candidatus Accumulibacter sp.]|nr:hypothetical protein [Accumulibacter sp.]
MQLAQILVRDPANIAAALAPLREISADLILAFGAGDLLRALAPHLPAAFPEAR